MKATIGLEIHVELKTKTKMFCSSVNNPEAEKPNINICPICLAHPGTLPTINQSAVLAVLKVGSALGGRWADFTEFDRKNYFYPDIPKGYQISQYKYPLISGGSLAGVEITRIHLEEDTAKLQHDPKTGAGLVDFNRAGVPLMELVTEPVVKDATQAGNFAREFRLLIGPEYLDISGANLEKGEMRIEANVSWDMGDKVEIKNLNSFKSVEKAIEYELARQKKLLAEGGKVIQETRGFDDTKQITFSQRKKEQSHDYRYFPDPDLPKLYLSELFDQKEIAATSPETPWQKRARFAEKYQLKENDIEILLQTKARAGFFEATTSLLKNPTQYQIGANILVSEILGHLGELDSTQIKLTETRIGEMTPEALAKLTELFTDNILSSRGVKDIIPILIKSGGDPEEIAKENNLLQQNDIETLQKIVEQIIVDNPAVIKDYQAGKDSVLKFLVGQGMKLSKGSANPQTLTELLKKALTE